MCWQQLVTRSATRRWSLWQLHAFNPRIHVNPLKQLPPRSSLPFSSAALRPVPSAGSDDRGLVYQTDAEASVLTAIRDFFLGQPGGGALVHRLAIFDAHGDITRIVSQMDVLK